MDFDSYVPEVSLRTSTDAERVEVCTFHEEYLPNCTCCSIYCLFVWCLICLYVIIVYNLFVGRDSSVGIPTRYGLDGPGIESQWGRDFPHPSRPALGTPQPPIQWVPGLSRG